MATATNSNSSTPAPVFKVIDDGNSSDDGAVFRFNEPGDQFTGTFLGMEEITLRTGEITNLARFVDDKGFPWVIFPGGNLKKSLPRVQPGALVQITFTHTIDTGKPSPMKVYSLAVAE